jgi:hypothetical protein
MDKIQDVIPEAKQPELLDTISKGNISMRVRGRGVPGGPGGSRGWGQWREHRRCRRAGVASCASLPALLEGAPRHQVP